MTTIRLPEVPHGPLWARTEDGAVLRYDPATGLDGSLLRGRWARRAAGATEGAFLGELLDRFGELHTADPGSLFNRHPMPWRTSFLDPEVVVDAAGVVVLDARSVDKALELIAVLTAHREAARS